MPARSTVLRLHDMLESINGIEKAIAGKAYASFTKSWTLKSAVERGIEIISEASRHIPESVEAASGRPMEGYRRHRQYPAPRISAR